MRTFILLLVVGLLVYNNLPVSTPANTPLQSQIRAAFAQSDNPWQAYKDRKKFSALCYKLADIIESDPKSVLNQGHKLDEFRAWSRYFQLDGERYHTSYPALAESVGKYLTEACGTNGGTLTEAEKEKYVLAYRELGKAAE